MVGKHETGRCHNMEELEKVEHVPFQCWSYERFSVSGPYSNPVGGATYSALTKGTTFLSCCPWQSASPTTDTGVFLPR
ncbi:hypothetical protein UPYG_G00163280 [Umbra pygmaea]|uniref:Uncharacterized protein n=1 Tax=Umbra pygmaea TaxID=75934 RepID=A0ABD0WRR2_UMBPY